MPKANGPPAHAQQKREQQLASAPAQSRPTPQKTRPLANAQRPYGQAGALAQGPMGAGGLPEAGSAKLVEEAVAMARAAPSLADLRAALAAFDGCSLKHSAKNLVFGDGNPEGDVMFIGEAPGRDEDMQGLPFVGRAGQLLDKMMAAIKRDRTNSYITNILPWRPPGNRKPSLDEQAMLQPFIHRHIELVNPKSTGLSGRHGSPAIARQQGRYHASKGTLERIQRWRTGHPRHVHSASCLPPAHPGPETCRMAGHAGSGCEA